MALERSCLAPTPVDADSAAVTIGGSGMLTAFEGVEDENRGTGARLPRWTRQEILVLILGKRMAEARVRRGRASGMAFGSGHVEPKWASISSYCKQNGVNRGPVQCRKRWSNLAGDYKKIKEWESHIKDDAESFWAMRNDLRRERKLPGFYDREVYDILDSGTTAAESVKPAGLVSSLAPSVDAEEDGKACEEEEVQVQTEAEAFFDSLPSAAKEDGLFSDYEHSTQEEAGGGGRSDKEFPQGKEVPLTSVPAPFPISDAKHGPHPTSNSEMGATAEEGRKRKRLAADGDEETDTVQDRLVKILERNSRMLSAQLEAQNINIQLDREQRKDHMDGLVAVLDKLAGALGKVADKLLQRDTRTT